MTFRCGDCRGSWKGRELYGDLLGIKNYPIMWVLWKTQSKGPLIVCCGSLFFLNTTQKSWITIKQPVLYKWKVSGCSFLCQYEHPVVPFPTCYSDISSVVGSSLEPKKVTTCSSHPNQTCQQKQHKTASKTHIFRTWKMEYVGICWNTIARVSFWAILAYFQGLSGAVVLPPQAACLGRTHCTAPEPRIRGALLGKNHRGYLLKLLVDTFTVNIGVLWICYGIFTKSNMYTVYYCFF